MSNTSNIATLSGFVRLPEVLQAVGLSRASIYRKMKDGNFPLQCSLEGVAVGWVRSEVQEWIDACIAQRDSRATPLAA
jgi:prophage regulatory protein